MPENTELGNNECRGVDLHLKEINLFYVLQTQARKIALK